MPAHNERFHASGGAVSSDTEQVTASFGSRPSLTDAPACRQAATTLCASAAVQFFAERVSAILQFCETFS